MVYIHGEEGEPSYFHATVAFEDHKGKTKLSMQMFSKTGANRDQVVEKYRAIEGLNQHIDKLAEYLVSM